MATDPYAPDDVKNPSRGLLRRLNSNAQSPVAPQGLRGAADGPAVNFVDPATLPRGVNYVDPAGSPPPTPGVRAGAQQLQAARTGQIPLPEGVRATNAAGIYEGKTGLHGERVFSDNPYDRGLRIREPGQTRYDFSTPGAQGDIASQAGLKRLSPEATRANEAQPRYGGGAINYDDLGSQVAANKFAQAETRVERGAGYDPTGYVAAQRANGGGMGQAPKPADALGAARLQLDATKFDAEQNNADRTRNDKMSDDIYQRHLADARANPDLVPPNGDPTQYATLAAAEELAARGVDPDFSRTPIGLAARDLVTRRVGGALRDAGGADTFTPGAPNDLSDYSFRDPWGKVDQLVGAAYDESGRRLSAEEAADRESKGLSINRTEAGIPTTVLGFNPRRKSDANTFNDPTMRRVTERITDTDRARKKKKAETK